MTTPNQQITTLLTSFAEFLGEQDKATHKLIEEKITQLKNDLLGGEVSADLDTIKELAEALQNLKSGESMPEKLIAKITEFKTALDTVTEQMTALNAADLKAAYLKGRNL